MSWVQIDSRKAHVSLYVEMAATSSEPRRFDYAASTYEISTSAVTRARHVLLRQGYRASSAAPFASYTRAKKAKGKITLEGGAITMVHAVDRAQDSASRKEEFTQVFKGETMTMAYTEGFVDTWRKIISP
jgi:hypothetical protein